MPSHAVPEGGRKTRPSGSHRNNSGPRILGVGTAPQILGRQRGWAEPFTLVWVWLIECSATVLADGFSISEPLSITALGSTTRRGLRGPTAGPGARRHCCRLSYESQRVGHRADSRLVALAGERSASWVLSPEQKIVPLPVGAGVDR